MSSEEQLADLLLQWEETLEQGHDIPAAELCHGCPELIDELSRRITALKSVAWVTKAMDSNEGEDDSGVPLLPPKEPLDGRYRLDKFIAQGGFGQVWQSFDLELERIVAVKLPKTIRLGSVDNFVAEARRVAQLKHPGIVPVFDVARHDGTCLIVSEFVEGGSLTERVGNANTNDSVRWIAEIADTLSYAHDQGFFHRDIKPSNILIDHHGRALLTDFGIALSSRETEATPSIGTLAYMSPEQLEGKPPDRRSDIFSLGVVLVELLTGRRPFNEESPSQLRRHIQTGEYSLGGLPSGLEPIIRKCLERDLNDRYSDVSLLASDLRGYVPRSRDKKAYLAIPIAALLGGVALIGYQYVGDRHQAKAASVSSDPIKSQGSPPTPAVPMPKAAEKLHIEAGELVRSGNYAEALKLLERAGQLDRV